LLSVRVIPTTEVEMTRIRMLLITALAVIGLTASSAFAVTFFPPVTGFEDDDIDFLLKATGNTQAGVIEQGDRLAGVVEYNRTFGVFGGGPALVGPGQELTGVFDITVLSKTQTGFIDTNGNTIQDPGEAGLFTFVFAPTGAGGLLAGQAAGTMASLWLDNSPDLEIVPPNCGSLAACEILARDGSLFMDIGFNGDPNESWIAINAPDSTAAVASAPASTKLGEFNFFLNILTNGTGQNLGGQICTPFCPAGDDNAVQLIGSGDILGGQGLANGAFARSDTDFQVATVTEPSALLLLGIGLLSINFISRRRIKK
jgi:hypothetical protein